MLIEFETSRMYRRSAPKKPAPKSSAVPIRITDRDIKIFEYLHKFRIADRSTLQQIFFGATNQSHTIHRLKELYDYGFIERIERWGRGPVYRVANRGMDAIASRQGITPGTIAYWGQGDDRDWRPTKISQDYLEHMLTGAKLRQLFEMAAEKSGAVIEQWQDDFDLQPTWKTERVKIKTEPDNKIEDMPVTPDAAFTVSYQGWRSYFFLEADRGTQRDSRVWQRKIKAYAEYQSSGKFHQKYKADPAARMRVLIPTTSVKRAVNLIEKAKKYAPNVAELFLSTAYSALNDDLLTTPIWVRSGHTEPQALFKNP